MALPTHVGAVPDARSAPAPQLPCNQPGQPGAAWPTLMGTASSYAFRPGQASSVLVYTVTAQPCWTEPTAAETEFALGYLPAHSLPAAEAVQCAPNSIPTAVQPEAQPYIEAHACAPVPLQDKASAPAAGPASTWEDGNNQAASMRGIKLWLQPKTAVPLPLCTFCLFCIFCCRCCTGFLSILPAPAAILPPCYCSISQQGSCANSCSRCTHATAVPAAQPCQGSTSPSAFARSSSSALVTCTALSAMGHSRIQQVLFSQQPLAAQQQCSWSGSCPLQQPCLSATWTAIASLDVWQQPYNSLMTRCAAHLSQDSVRFGYSLP